MYKKLLKFVIFSFLLSSCATTKLHQLDLSIRANSGLNPNSQNKPSPLVLRVYALKNSEKFQDLDLPDILNQDLKKTLSEDFLTLDEMIIHPGQNTPWEKDYSVHEGLSFIAIVAGFRDYKNSTWKEIINVKGSKNVKLEIDLGTNYVTVRK